MNGLSELIEQLDGTNSTLQKQRIVKQFFLSLDVSEWVYAVALFTGRRPKKLITSTQMRQLAVEISGMPVWLFESCYGIVGDLAETISLVVPSGEGKLSMGLKEMFDWFEIQAEKPDAQRMQAVATLWSGMSSKEIFVFNKMITGSWNNFIFFFSFCFIFYFTYCHNYFLASFFLVPPTVFFLPFLVLAFALVF